jgi:E3 ubiquitin-protein ligase SHPRH
MHLMGFEYSTVVLGIVDIVLYDTNLAKVNNYVFRHTKARSLKVSIYEGARNLDSLVQKVDITELAASDIVLTTYDVLKEDLSHDSDRHDGDRLFLRFQKK